MQPKWEIAVTDLKYEPSVPKAALRYGGTIDKINGLDAVALPNSYLVKFGPKVSGVMSPADRQEVSRWINQVHQNITGGLSSYLAEAVKFAEANACVILVLDLHDVPSPAGVKQRLTVSPALQGRQLDLDPLSQALAGVQGVMLGITVGQERYGKIKIDFTADVSALGDLAKPLLLEMLADNGVMIEEFRDWTARVSGTQITLEGKLYQSGMQRILSILDAPSSARANLRDEDDPSPGSSSEQLVALTSQQYYKSVVSLLEDLKVKRTSSEFVSWGQVGTWFQKYARKIDNLPILNVDPELLDYGAYVADSLRQAESAMKGIGANVGMRKTEVPNYYTVNTYAAPIGVSTSGAYGMYSWTAREDLAAKGQAEARIRTQERIRGNADANLIAQGIAAATADIRRRMTQKYQVEF
jgi:hypothetical protein